MRKRTKRKLIEALQLVGIMCLGFVIGHLLVIAVARVFPPELRKPDSTNHWLEKVMQEEGIPFECASVGPLSRWLVSSKTQRYTDDKGENSLLLLLQEKPESDSLEILLPYVFVFPPGDGMGKVSLLPVIQYNLKLLQLDYDPNDGEVRGMVRLPGFRQLKDQSLDAIIQTLVADVDETSRLLEVLELPDAGRKEKSLMGSPVEFIHALTGI